MELEFSKTRVVYYQNNANKLAKTNWQTKISVRAASTKDANKNIRVGSIKGEDHGWHFVPTNNWGLYVTFNEFISLLENSSHVQPIGINVNISHAIPLAKYPGTANTTQLSFNNTIYSLIYDLVDTDMVRAPNPYNDIVNYTDFCRSFDGSSWSNGTDRVNLPLPSIEFKIPFAIVNDDITKSDNMTKAESINIFTGSDKDTILGNLAGNTGQEQPLGLDDLKLSYLPEFLQDNANVKVLFPGENIDSYEFSDPNNNYAGFNTETIQYGESFANLDLRNYYTNSINCPISPEYLLSADVFPTLRGPTDYDKSVGICWPNDWDILDNTDTRSIIEETGALAHGYNYNNQYTRCVPQKFIKGIPLIDPSNALINHQFCVLLSHTLKVKITPRKPIIPRPLQYDCVYPFREVVTQIQKNATDPTKPVYTRGVRTVFKRSFPFKPMHPTLYAQFERRLRASNVTSQVTIAKINNTLPDIDLNATNLEESIATDWTVTDGICFPTKTYLPNKGQSKTGRSKRKRR